MKNTTAVARATTIRAAIYARYSSDAQKATSIEDQERNCRRRADNESWQVVAIFSDEAISGATSDRPGYQRMQRAALRREFDVLILDDLSRLSRDSLECEKVIRKLEFASIRIVSGCGYDSESKAKKIHRGFRAMQNEMFRDDLADKVHRGLTGQALRGHWCGGRPYGYRLQPITDASQRDAYGHAAQVGTRLVIDAKQARVIKEIFQMYVDGQSHRAIAAELNERGVPSVGTTWKRKKYRSRGWVGSAVRVITMNRLYVGEVVWNKTRFVIDPNTERTVRRARPKSEWITHRDESLRIVTDAVFAKAQARTKIRSNSDARLKCGGKPKYLLSGLLKCGECGSSFVFADGRAYACSGLVHGGACSNRTRVRKDVLERVIIGAIRDELLDPSRVARMAKELERRFAERVKTATQKGIDAPREVAELDARLDRLRARLRSGDHADMEPDEIQAAIERVEAKRRELAAAQSSGSAAKIITLLPKAAEAYRRQVEAGLDGHPERAAKARGVLRELVGPVQIKTERDGSVWAEYEARPAALLNAAGVGTYTAGRGDRI